MAKRESPVWVLGKPQFGEGHRITRLIKSAFEGELELSQG